MRFPIIPPSIKPREKSKNLLSALTLKVYIKIPKITAKEITIIGIFIKELLNNPKRTPLFLTRVKEKNRDISISPFLRVLRIESLEIWSEITEKKQVI